MQKRTSKASHLPNSHPWSFLCDSSGFLCRISNFIGFIDMDVHIFYYTLFYALPLPHSPSLSLPLSTVCLAISIYYPTQTHAHTLSYLPIAHIHALVYSFKCPFYICTATMNVGRKEEKGYTIKCCPCICIRFLFRMCMAIVVIVPRYHTKKRITSTDGTCKDGCSLRSMYWLKHSGF